MPGLDVYTGARGHPVDSQNPISPCSPATIVANHGFRSVHYADHFPSYNRSSELPLKGVGESLETSRSQIEAEAVRPIFLVFHNRCDGEGLDGPLHRLLKRITRLLFQVSAQF